MTYPIAWIRDQFPAVKRGDAVYLDNAAGAQVPQQVVDNMVEALTTMQVNKGGAYAQSERIGAAKETVREGVATFLNAAPPTTSPSGRTRPRWSSFWPKPSGASSHRATKSSSPNSTHHANVDPWRA